MNIVTDHQFSRLIDLGLAAAHLGEPALARALFENLLIYAPGHAPAQIGLAFSHVVTGNFAAARSILEDEVLTRDPDDADALALLGLTLSLSGEAGKAAAYFTKTPPAGAAGKFVAVFLAEAS
jgi:Flp pilus assembly protein TadD